MSEHICCVVNAHREGNVLFPTLSSVKRAVSYAEKCGLTVSVHIVLDNSDDTTKEVVNRECTAESMVIHEVAFKDLAHSRNYAVEKSTGKYMAFVDGDDLWSRNWLVDSYVLAERGGSSVVWHPEYNIFFGDKQSHVFNHVDMDAQDFEMESLFRMNYWTALSFAQTRIFREHPYKENRIMDGFGYEDWTWNYETIQSGIKHKVVAGTVHFIRKGRPQASLLAQTNEVNALPRILDIYRESEATDQSDSEVPVVECLDDAILGIDSNLEPGELKASNENVHSETLIKNG